MPPTPGTEPTPDAPVVAQADLGAVESPTEDTQENPVLEAAEAEAIDHELPAPNTTSNEGQAEAAQEQTAVERTVEESGLNANELSPEMHQQLSEVLADLDKGSAKVAEGQRIIEEGRQEEAAAGNKLRDLLKQASAEQASGPVIVENVPEHDQSDRVPHPSLTPAYQAIVRRDGSAAAQAAETHAEDLLRVSAAAEQTYEQAINQQGAIADAQAQTLGANPRPFAGEQIVGAPAEPDTLITEVPDFSAATAEAAPTVGPTVENPSQAAE